MDDKNCFRTALARHGRAIAPGIVDGLVERKAHYFFGTLSDAVALFPGVEGLIREAAEKVPLAIASGALREEIEFLLWRWVLREFFPVVVAAEDVVRGKPDPEAYIAALGRLNRLISGRPVRPSECLVVEDSPHAVSRRHKFLPARGADRRPLRFEEPGAGRPATDY